MTAYTDIIIFPPTADELPMRYLVPSEDWEEFIQDIHGQFDGDGPVIIPTSRVHKAIDLEPQAWYNDQFDQEAYDHYKTLDDGDLAEIYREVYLKEIQKGRLWKPV